MLESLVRLCENTLKSQKAEEKQISSLQSEQEMDQE